MKRIGLLLSLILLLPFSAMAAQPMTAQQWAVFETSFTSANKYDNPFMDVQVEVVFRCSDQQWVVPAFWAGGDSWTVRFAPPVQGDYTFRVKSTDPSNKDLNGDERTLQVTAYTGDNPLLKHGFLRVAKDNRHFEHADGTPFFWLGDTWWKCLAKGDASAWKDYGSPAQRKDGKLLGAKSMLTLAETVSGKDLMVSVDARSDAEAGIVLRFHDPDNYVVAFYSPHFKGITIHDRRDGAWGEALGMVKTPEIGADIRLTAAVSGEYAALVVTDGKKTWRTPPVRVRNTTAGKAGLWFYQIGEKQTFDNFEVSATRFVPVAADDVQGQKAPTADYAAPNLPSPQDWVLVLERVESCTAQENGGRAADR